MAGEELGTLDLPSEALASLAVPETVKEAVGDPNWRQVMQRGYDSLTTNPVWSLAPGPNDRQPIKKKWPFAPKRDSQGRIRK